jgi:hypothetical protein
MRGLAGRSITQWAIIANQREKFFGQNAGMERTKATNFTPSDRLKPLNNEGDYSLQGGLSRSALDTPLAFSLQTPDT